MPQRQPKTNQKIDDQHAEQYTLAQTPRVEGKSAEQHDPYDVGRRGPTVVRPFIIVAGDAAKRNPREVGAAEEAGHAP